MKATMILSSTKLVNTKSTFFAGLALAMLSSTCFADGAAHWGYEGKVGPSNWGSLEKEFATCKVGQMQAPIDILTKAAAPASAPIAAKYKASAGEIINNGHTIQVALPDGGSAILSGTDYKLLQFHFHTPAEEKVDGKGYPFNAHMVHKSADGKLVVIGILFKEGNENNILKDIFANMPSKEGKVAIKSNFDASSMLPSSLAYYSYAGSLTTPPCSEGVSFYILKAPVELSKNQLNAFQKVFKMNARPLQPLNGRKITQSS